MLSIRRLLVPALCLVAACGDNTNVSTPIDAAAVDARVADAAVDAAAVDARIDAPPPDGPPPDGPIDGPPPDGPIDSPLPIDAPAIDFTFVVDCMPGNCGDGYAIDGQGAIGAIDPALKLIRGKTYFFVITAPGHPFAIHKTPGNVGTGERYDDGVTGQGTEAGTLTFAVPLNAPDTLYYQCERHSLLGGEIGVVNAPPP